MCARHCKIQCNYNYDTTKYNDTNNYTEIIVNLNLNHYDSIYFIIKY